MKPSWFCHERTPGATTIGRRAVAIVVALAAFVAAMPQQPLAAAEPAAVSIEGDLLRKTLESQGYVAVDITRRKSGYLTTNVQIGEAKLQLLVDTGAVTTCLDRARTEVLGLRWKSATIGGDSKATQLKGVEAKAITIDVCPLQSLKIGSVSASPLDATHINTFPFNSILRADGEPPLDGFLGDDVLTSRAAVIDYPNGRMYLQPTGAKPSLAEGEAVRKRLSLQGYVCVDLDRGRIGYLAKSAQVEAVELYFMVDTGAPLTYLDLGRTDKKGLRWTFDAKPDPMSRLGSYRCDLETLNIGGITLNSVSAVPHDMASFNSYMTTIGGREVDGLLGNDVLTKHAAVVDVAGRRLFLQPAGKR